MTLRVVVLWLTTLANPLWASEVLRDRLEQIVAQQAEADAASRFFAPQLLLDVYRQRQFEFLWSERRANGVVSLIMQAPSHGLEVSDYLPAELLAPLSLARMDPVTRANTDLAITEALLRYVCHLSTGKVDSDALQASWNLARIRCADGARSMLQSLIEADDLTMRVERDLSHGFLYENLRGWLVRYRAMVEAGGWADVGSGPTLQAGDASERVLALRRRLAAEGFDPGDAESSTFDGELEARVRDFQTRHGIAVDGRVGRRTVAAMNVPAGARLDQIRANLERLRWVTQSWERRLVGVNIAGYRVYYIEGNAVRWSSRAVVGKPYRQTPVFRSEMTYMVLNPDWTIPPTILKNDTLPAIRGNPDYLARERMDVLDLAGRRVDPSTIDWSRYPEAPFPYLIRQRPGPTNALGRIKFNFPNEHFVFLHDTPAKRLFELSERIFSSGCIRVERPFELADLLLRDDPRWQGGVLEAEAASGATRTIFLETPVPVVILYLTAIATDHDQFNLFADVYRRDRAVLAALDTRAISR